MTTIAYKDGILAGDTRISDEDGHIWTDNSQKVFRLKDGSLIGASGDAEAGDMLIEAIRNSDKDFTLPEGSNVCALRVMTDGRLYLSEGGMWMRWPEPYAAIGSGKRCALTALRLGASARDAVKEGIAGDCYSGGKIISVKLKGTK